MATAIVILLAVACGGSPGAAPRTTTTVDRSTASAAAVGFSRCMRSNGVTNYPDPTSSGTVPKESPQQLGVGRSRFEAAIQACRHLLPGGGSGPTPVELQQIRAKGLAFSQCMRRHGVALPDPDSTGRIPDPASVGIDQGSPRFRAANQACARSRPPYLPSNGAYNAYARSHGS